MSKIENPSDWFDNVLPGKVAGNPKKAGGFEGTFCFKLSGDKGGDWSVTLEGEGVEVKPEPNDNPLFTISMKDEDFVKMINGELKGQVAFMTGKLKFKGDMGKAMKLQGLLF